MSQVEDFDRYNKIADSHRYDMTDHVGPLYKKEVLDPFIAKLHEFSDRPLVLDLASGMGEAGDYFVENGCEAIKLDISEIALSLSTGARVRGMMDALPFPKNRFDAIHCKDAIVHVPHIMAMLKESKRVLKKGGSLLLVSQTVTDGNFEFDFKSTGKHTSTFISGKEDYLDRLHALKVAVDSTGEPKYTNFSAPYFRTTPEFIIGRAKILKMAVTELPFWAPPYHQPDWHRTPVGRFVLEITKP